MDTERYRVRPGEALDLAAFPPDGTEGHAGGKQEAKRQTAALATRLGELQVLLHASKAAKVLVVLQGLDTSGKDNTTRRVFRSTNPLGVRVVEFKRPTDHELAHEYLWRVSRRTPRDGEIVVFNRSHYEDVLVPRVDELVEPEVWQRRFGHLVDFERRLVDEGTVIRKFFLHVSKDEQKERLEKRLTTPEKHWKFDPGDLRTRRRWDDYQEAYRDALQQTSTEAAPWWVVPADRKWFRDLLVSQVLVDALDALDMAWPDRADALRDVVIE